MVVVCTISRRFVCKGMCHSIDGSAGCDFWLFRRFTQCGGVFQTGGNGGRLGLDLQHSVEGFVGRSTCLLFGLSSMHLLSVRAGHWTVEPWLSHDARSYEICGRSRSNQLLISNRGLWHEYCHLMLLQVMVKNAYIDARIEEKRLLQVKDKRSSSNCLLIVTF
mmetsp:Transcript_4800/g.12004  ORF Transcript_4800/g.12004 Transcript_4800/m.12004 type:complete len:163 (+) Transcript_4800:1283-1771(+)